MNSQFQNSFTNWVFSFLDQSNIVKNIPWLFADPFLIAIKASQDVNDILYSNLRNFYSSFSYGDLTKAISDDPFRETKKKCLPQNIDHLSMQERLLVKMENSYFTSTPLTIEKRDGPSFTDKTSNNLILDKDDVLMQLIFNCNPNSSLPPGQQLMQVIEYRIGWKIVARKFQTYINR